MSSEIFDKVLVCAPTASAKKYCFEAWIANVMQFTYPNFNVMLSDNSEDDGVFTDYMLKYVQENFAHCQPEFEAINTCKVRELKKGKHGVIERMAYSHNDCRLIALSRGYDYILHLETDVFPSPDIIENLLLHRKQVVGAVYYRDEGYFRKPTLQRNVRIADDFMISLNLDHKEDIVIMDGGLHKAASVGLGCVLIHKSVLRTIEFRHEGKRSFHPDSYFSMDCLRNNIPIFADTSQICRHDNRRWGVYGVDFN